MKVVHKLFRSIYAAAFLVGVSVHIAALLEHSSILASDAVKWLLFGTIGSAAIVGLVLGLRLYQFRYSVMAQQGLSAISPLTGFKVQVAIFRQLPRWVGRLQLVLGAYLLIWFAIAAVGADKGVLQSNSAIKLVSALFMTFTFGGFAAFTWAVGAISPANQSSHGTRPFGSRP